MGADGFPRALSAEEVALKAAERRAGKGAGLVGEKAAGAGKGSSSEIQPPSL